MGSSEGCGAFFFEGKQPDPLVDFLIFVWGGSCPLLVGIRLGDTTFQNGLDPGYPIGRRPESLVKVRLTLGTLTKCPLVSFFFLGHGSWKPTIGRCQMLTTPLPKENIEWPSTLLRLASNGCSKVGIGMLKCVQRVGLPFPGGAAWEQDAETQQDPPICRAEAVLLDDESGGFSKGALLGCAVRHRRS